MHFFYSLLEMHLCVETRETQPDVVVFASWLTDDVCE